MQQRDSGYETPLNSPVKQPDEEESTSEESIELTRNDVFIESDDDGSDEVRKFSFRYCYQ